MTVQIVIPLLTVLVTVQSHDAETVERPGLISNVPVENVTVVAMKPVHSPPQQVVEVLVPAGARLVIGSLDQTASPHVVHVESFPARQDHKLSEPRLSHMHAVDPADRPAADRPTRDPFVPRRGVSSCVVVSEQTVTQRRFEIPWFDQGRVYSQCRSLKSVMAGARTMVYATEDDPRVKQLARAIVAAVDDGLVEFVEQQIGELRDLDGDGHVSYVIAELSGAEEYSTAPNPVHGCVRAADFRVPSGPFSGDIIYLDPRLPLGELHGILGHELTHAAIFSSVVLSGRHHGFQSPRQPSLPCWLNEAMAHSVERQVDSDSTNLRDRQREFLRHPHLFPVVIPDHCTELSLRRGPSRAAGVRFLLATMANYGISHPGSLLYDDRGAIQCLEDLTTCRLENLLWEWAVDEAIHNEAAAINLPLSNRIDIKLRGTAFTSLSPSNEPRKISLTCGAECRLKAAVVQSSRTRLAAQPQQNP